MKLTLDSTIGELIDNAKAKAILDQYIPGVSTHPDIVTAKDMSLSLLLSMPMVKRLGLTREKADLVLTEINKVL